jgi:hypothetical protein
VANAKPEIIANERKKAEDAQAKLLIVKEQLASLAGGVAQS